MWKYQFNAFITFPVTTDVHDFLGQPSYVSKIDNKPVAEPMWFQQSVTDGKTDDGKSDTYVALCFVDVKKRVVPCLWFAGT